jgi:hypothetical protein
MTVKKAATIYAMWQITIRSEERASRELREALQELPVEDFDEYVRLTHEMDAKREAFDLARMDKEEAGCNSTPPKESSKPPES